MIVISLRFNGIDRDVLKNSNLGKNGLFYWDWLMYFIPKTTKK